MPTYRAKSTAPEFFSLADAFISLITGDPTWGWLVDWMTLIPNTGQETAAFCAEGPIFAEALSFIDFIPSSNPLDPRNAIHTAALAARIAAAARDRVFGAYCEQFTDPADWCLETITTVTGPHTTQADVWVPFPAGSTSVRIGLQGQNQGTGGANTAAFLTSDAGVADLVNIHGYDASTVTWSGAWEGPFDRGVHNYVYLSAKFDYIADWHIQFGPCFGEPVPYGPEPQPQPDGVSSPLRTVDPSLDGIALELERLEFKLDNLMPLLQLVAGATIDLGGPLDEPVDAPADEVIAVTDAVGYVVTITGIPDQADIGFGVPQRLARLGWINCGTDGAWYPSIPLTHTPMVVRPLPPGTTRLTITQLPPGAAAAVQAILPLK